LLNRGAKELAFGPDVRRGTGKIDTEATMQCVRCGHDDGGAGSSAAYENVLKDIEVLHHGGVFEQTTSEKRLEARGAMRAARLHWMRDAYHHAHLEARRWMRLIGYVPTTIAQMFRGSLVESRDPQPVKQPVHPVKRAYKDFVKKLAQARAA
jgi:hypothetical protein